TSHGHARRPAGAGKGPGRLGAGARCAGGAGRRGGLADGVRPLARRPPSRGNGRLSGKVRARRRVAGRTSSTLGLVAAIERTTERRGNRSRAAGHSGVTASALRIVAIASISRRGATKGRMNTSTLRRLLPV